MPDKPAPNLYITLFGGLRARCGGGGPILFPPQQVGVLLAVLALHADRLHTRDELASLLWPDLDAESARPNLRQQIYALRKQLAAIKCPESAIVATRTTIRLNLDMVTTDVARFEQLIASASADHEPDSRLEHLQEAAELYRGELLPGFHQDTFITERGRLSLVYRDAMLQLASAYSDTGDLASGIQTAKRAVAVDHLHEESHRLLMGLYSRAEMGAEAVRQYQELERALECELGSRPSAATARLLTEIRSATQSTGQSPAAASNPPRDSPLPPPYGRADPIPIPTSESVSELDGRTEPRRKRRIALASGPILLLLLASGVWFAQKQLRRQPVLEVAATPANPVLWVARYHPGPGDKDSEANAMVVTPGKDILVTGFIQTQTEDVDILTVGYDERGNQRWQARYSGPGHEMDRGRFVAAGLAGCTYVAGESDNGRGNDSTRLSGLDIVILKYDKDGKPSSTWPDVGFHPGVRRYNGAANGEDTPAGLLVDSQGYVYVLGTSWGPGPGGRKPGYDVVLLKYSPAGELVRQFRYDGRHGDDTAAAFARDRDGDFFIAATSRAEPITGPENDIVVLRVNAQCEKVWETRWGSLNHADDRATAINVDAGGNLNVIGEGRGLPGTLDANAVGCIDIKYDTRGNLRWCRGTSTEDDRITTVTHVLFGDDGLAVVSGTVQKPDGSTYARTVMRDVQGLTRWAHTTWQCGQGEGSTGLAWGAPAHTIVSGVTHRPQSNQDMYVVEYDAEGNPFPTRFFDLQHGTDFNRALAMLDGSPVLAGQTQSGTSRDLTVVRFR